MILPANATFSHRPAHAKLHPNGASSQHEKLVNQTQKVVSQTFYGTMLKQMHDSPFKSDMMNGGRGGQVFSGLLDQRLAEHMAGNGHADKLVNSIVKHIERVKHLNTSSLSNAAKSAKTIRPPIQKGIAHVPAGLRA